MERSGLIGQVATDRQVILFTTQMSRLPDEQEANWNHHSSSYLHDWNLYKCGCDPVVRAWKLNRTLQNQFSQRHFRQGTDKLQQLNFTVRVGGKVGNKDSPGK